MLSSFENEAKYAMIMFDNIIGIRESPKAISKEMGSMYIDIATHDFDEIKMS
jgi:hypothetical protein